MHSRSFAILGACVLAAAATACGGGGGGGYGGAPPPQSTPGGGTTQQVIREALPSSAIGSFDDPTYGLVAGFTQAQTSQILGFAPGQQVMIENAQAASSGVPHTLGDTGGVGSFPQTANLSSQSNTPNNGTLGAGFQSGTIDPGSMVGPFTLSTGTYFIGCFYHYASKGMRDVLIVAADAHPGSAGTPPPGDTPPPSGGGY